MVRVHHRPSQGPLERRVFLVGDDRRGAILEIVNAGAEAYRGVIPADRWHEPYMSAEQLEHLVARAERPLLVGTWAAAEWAIRFYERNGFETVGTEEKNRLLRTYWSIPERQVETSVVLAHRTAARREGD